MTWADMDIGGRTYPLSHLQPFTVDVTPKSPGAPTFKMYVSFGSHTFSKEWHDESPEDHKMDNGREVRCFCPLRHAHSLLLPAIIQEAVTGRAYFSQSRNYLLIENPPGMNAPYAVFFNIERAKSRDFDVAMFVVSAYVKPGLPKGIPRITFATLVAKTARGEPVTRPKK